MLEQIQEEDYAIYFLFIFLLIGIGSLFFGWFTRRKFLLFGKTPLTLSPQIGQVGGQIGGIIELEKYWGTHDLTVTLNCINKYTTYDNERNTTHNNILWLQENTPVYSQISHGSKIEFCFEVPAGQYTKKTYKGRGTIFWEVIVEGVMNGVKFKRSWEIPVEEGTQASSIVISNRHKDTSRTVTQQKAQESIEQQINTKRTSTGLDITSEQGRNKSTSIFILLFGAIFTTIGYMTFDEYEFVKLIVGSVFFVIGCAVLCFSLFLAGRKLECIILGDTVKTRRSLFGCTISKNVAKLTSEKQLSLEVTMSSTINGKLTETMAIYANVSSPKNKKIKLVEGIQGRDAAKAMKKKLVNTLTSNSRFS